MSVNGRSLRGTASMETLDNKRNGTMWADDDEMVELMRGPIMNHASCRAFNRSRKSSRLVWRMGNTTASSSSLGSLTADGARDQMARPAESLNSDHLVALLP